MYEVLRKAIKKILLEEFHEDNPSLPNNNSLNATSDSGNIKYDRKIDEFYSISESDTSENLEDSFSLTIKVREEFKKFFKDNGIPISTINYKSNDLNIFQTEKRNIINKLYVTLGNSGII